MLPGVGAFDHLEWTTDGAFKQLFDLAGTGNLNKNFPKIQMPGVCPGGGYLSFDLTGTYNPKKSAGKKWLKSAQKKCSKSRNSAQKVLKVVNKYL